MTGDPIEDNRASARGALTALQAFAAQNGQAYMLDGTLTIQDDLLSEVAEDLLCGLFHLARINDVDPEELTEQALSHYDTEVADEGAEEWPDAFHYKAP
ncbi:hypothetical protein [Streptomyces sp. NPDC021139]|uniref:hypothetical protein n=1 Tax=unclassified Streptomyces TaxID=2593676 RepID=UPI0033DFFBD6